MKGLNIKKLAAIAVGGALVGSALAPLAAAITVEKADVINTATGAPSVSVVAGTQAQVSDFVWAGNIAAKVAQLATIDAALEGGEGAVSVTDLSVDLTVGGDTAYTAEHSYAYHGTSYPLKSTVGDPSVEFRKVLGSGQLPFLTNTTKSYRYNGSTYEIVVKETVGLEADAKFDYLDRDVKDLVVYMSKAGDLNYVLDLGQGIPCWSSTSATTTAFTDSDNDNIVIPFLGDEYTVQSCDITSTTKEIKLIKESAKTNYAEGDEITGLTGRGAYAGEELSVKIAAITTSGVATDPYDARFELYDAEGNLVHSMTVAADVYLNESFVDTVGEYALETVVYISTIRIEPTTSKGVVTTIVGKDVVTLADGQEYPYDSTKTTVSEDYWKAVFDTNATTANSSPAVGTVKKITVKNNVTKWNDKNPLWSADDSLTQTGIDAAAAGEDTAHFLEGEAEGTLGYDFVKVKFDGFKIDQSTTTLKVGDGSVVYTDNARIERTIPFYIQLDNTSTESTFTVDNQTFYYRCSSEDVNLLIWDTNYLNGAVVDINCQDGNIATDLGVVDVNAAGKATKVDLNGVEYDPGGNSASTAGQSGVYLLADGNCEFSSQVFSNVDHIQLNAAENYTKRGGGSAGKVFTTKTVYYDDDNTSRVPLKLPLSITNDTMEDTYKYRMYVARPGSDQDVYLLLDGSTDFSNEFTKADVGFKGTDLYEAGDGTNASDAAPYYWPDTPDFGNTTGDPSYFVAKFVMDLNGGDNDANIYIDTATDDLVTLPNDQLSSYGSDVNFGVAGWSLNVRTDADQYLQAAWVDYGSTIKLTDDKKTVTAVVPEAQIYLSLTVLGEGATVTTAGGDSVEGVEEGETARIDSIDVTVGAINYTAGTCTVADTTYPAIVPVGKIVVTDADARPAKAIIVGGYLVNILAQNIVLGDGSTLQEALTAPGDKVAELLDSGDIVVAGYTAADTGVAAQELIDALEDLV